MTNSAGLSRLPELPVGLYEPEITKEGFGKLVRGDIRLLTGQTVDMTLALCVGQASQPVEVGEAVRIVQSATSELQTTVDSRQMEELPLNGRNAFQLAVLTPGAVESDAGQVLGQQDNVALAVNGLRATQNESTIR